MKKLGSIKEFIEVFARKLHMTQECSELILKTQASLKEHVLNRNCSYCEKKVDLELFKNESEKYDYFSHGMCKSCIMEMQKEPNNDLKWLN